jgi:hypothetical protein
MNIASRLVMTGAALLLFSQHASRPGLAEDRKSPVLRYIPGSTIKIEQLVEELDKEHQQPTRGRTVTRYQLHGTDLGYSFDHEGRTYFLFVSPEFAEFVANHPPKINSGTVLCDFDWAKLSGPCTLALTLLLEYSHPERWFCSGLFFRRAGGSPGATGYVPLAAARWSSAIVSVGYNKPIDCRLSPETISCGTENFPAA